MRIQPWESGLVDWLDHHGIGIDRSFVLDEQNAPFPTPVVRKVGGYEFRDAQLIDYPYFIDIRGQGLNQQHPATSNIPQLTLAWASPMDLKRGSGLRITNLLRSSPNSWRSKEMAVMPTVDGSGKSEFHSSGKQQSEELSVLVQGQFQSFFTGKTDLLAAAQPRDRDGVSALLEQSPKSARMIVFASNDFMDDQMLSAIVAGSGNQYLGPLELFMNTLDWSLQDDSLLQIRSRGHFNRTLPPMDRRAQTLIEYFNYAAVIILLAVFAFIFWLRSRQRKSYYRKSLAL